MVTFEVCKDENGKYGFKLRGQNGSTFLTGSASYDNKTDVLVAMESVRRSSALETRYVLKLSAGGKYYFNLKSSKGLVIGKGAMHDTEADRTSAIRTMMKEAEIARIEMDC